jgi:protein-S-isoprenylcysteine O-methyltransferase Ste14
MTLAHVFTAAAFIFFGSEVALGIFKRARVRGGKSEDRGSLLVLWTCIGAGVCLAMLGHRFPSGNLHLPFPTAAAMGLGLLAVGLAVRWTAILTLGRFFTANVAIQTGHQLVDKGIYRHLRHPSYSGLLLAFLGIGLAHDNWISLIVLMLPITAAVLNRIAKEEHALRSALGEPYADYCKRTKRLVPGVY